MIAIDCGFQFYFNVDRRIVTDMLKYCQDYASMEDGFQKLHRFFFGGSAFRALYYLEVCYLAGHGVQKFSWKKLGKSANYYYSNFMHTKVFY